MSHNKEQIIAEEHDSDNEMEEPEVKAVEEEEEDTSLSNSDVVTKYQEAAKIANLVLKELIMMSVPGVSVLEVCKAGDRLIHEKLSLIFRGKGKNGKPIDKGIAFPVCVSLNETVCHYSPLDSDATVPIIQENDVVKIDLGVHIDGYIAAVAHTIISTSAAAASSPVIINDKRANVFVAAYHAANLAYHMIRPGNTNNQVTDMISSVASLYNVRPIQHAIMHQIKRYVIDGNKRIALSHDTSSSTSSSTSYEKVDMVTFEPYEVYMVDVTFTSGEGKAKDKGYHRNTVYKRNIDRKYGLKMKASRSFYSEVNKSFPTFPFSLRELKLDENSIRLGIRECVTHDLISSYPILSENKDDVVVHVKFTVLVLPGRNIKITGLELAPGQFVALSSSSEVVSDDHHDEEIMLTEEMMMILASDESGGKKKKKNKNKKAAGVVDAEA